MLHILADQLACSPLQGALFCLHSIEKGGPRDDDIFPALSPASPGQRPANAFAGLTRDFLQNFFLVCPSWLCSVARSSARACSLIHRRALTLISDDGCMPRMS